jgi:uncharacterized phage-like protein YoqJ
MIVTFCGHSQVSRRDAVRSWLCKIVSQLIQEGAGTFYLGGYGEFDELAATAVKEQKALHPEIESVLVLPYLDRKWDRDRYDRSVYPGLEDVPPRYAICKRNQWMVEAADVVVAYVDHDWGGAAQTLAHARRRKKKVVLYPNYP